jgi:flagellin-specific chaperone FliS
VKQAPHPALRAYRAQQIEGQDPGRTILLVYDAARAACRERRMRTALQAVEELAAALDLEQGQIAEGLLALYAYVMRRIREGAWEDALRILDELRDTWAEALDRMGRDSQDTH